jgi:hypothetical protein
VANDASLKSSDALAVVVITILLYLSFVGIRWLGARLIRHPSPHPHTIWFETLRQWWVLLLLSIWLLLGIGIYVSDTSEAGPTTVPGSPATATVNGHPVSIALKVTGSDHFFVGQSSEMDVKVVAKGDAAMLEGLKAKVALVTDALSTHPIVEPTDESLAKPQVWTYLISPVNGGKGILGVRVSILQAGHEADELAWTFPLVVQRSVIPPGFISSQTLPSLLGIITAISALLSGTRALFVKKDVAPPAPPSSG